MRRRIVPSRGPPTAETTPTPISAAVSRTITSIVPEERQMRLALDG